MDSDRIRLLSGDRTLSREHDDGRGEGESSDLWRGVDKNGRINERKRWKWTRFTEERRQYVRGNAVDLWDQWFT